MKCPNCKKEIENGSTFCEHCGTRIKKSKKGLWITLSVVFVALIATIVVTTIQEQQEQIAREQDLAAQHQLELEQQLQAEREARQEAERQAEAQRKAKEEAERQAELVRQEAARKAEAERKAREEAERKTELAHQEAERKAELIRKGYIDLGLPSGTLWKNANEGGDYTRYTYDEAVSRFGNKLPTKQQFEELKNKCTWTWTGSGYKVIGPNGNSIYLPAAGYRDCRGDVYYVGTGGNYWSSTPYDSDFVWYLYFNSSAVRMNNYYRSDGLSVRLVQ